MEPASISRRACLKVEELQPVGMNTVGDEREWMITETMLREFQDACQISILDPHLATADPQFGLHAFRRKCHTRADGFQTGFLDRP